MAYEDGGGYGDSGPGGSSGDPAASAAGASPAGPGIGYGGYGGYSDYAPPAWNAAKDSQAANEELGLSPNSDSYGPVDYSGYGGSMSPFSRGLSDFAESPFGKVVRGLMSLNPIGRVANTAYGLATSTNPMSVALGLAPGPAGALARTAYGAATSGNPGGSLGSTAGGMFGSTVGNSLGGPIGGFLGGMFGSKVGGQAGSEIGRAGGAPSGSGDSGGLGGLLGGLAGAYGGYQASRAAGNNADAVNGQISNLSSMYSANSPYAAQLRQELARKDAASGRNSQYGPREAQLQALLAEKASSTAGTIGNLSTQAQAANTAKQTAQAQTLAQLLKLGQSSGLGGYLQNMFTSNNQAQPDFSGYNQDDYAMGR